MPPLQVLVVGATGGLGQTLVREALKRGHTVGVLVRSKEKLSDTFVTDEVARFAQVHISDGTDAATIASALKGVDVILNGVGSRPDVALALASAAKTANTKKLIHVAGSTNVLGEDGVTLEWKRWITRWSGAEAAFKSHQACIDAIAAAGVNYVVFCPSFMKSVGKVSTPPVAVQVNRPSGEFVSYEDAAVVMVDAAEKSDWDRQLITAATQQ
ncbi:hypothetical protein BC830DRAFT_1126815 [Chytriomyces sp. MP71]|nr:hypothetical protein BC830DRAFT_1126815 [Chytriomyces sp. MP71]